MWEDFVQALATPESAERVNLITARHHAPQTLMVGLRYLQRKLRSMHGKEVIAHLPPIENIHPVTHGVPVSAHDSVPMLKMQVIERLLTSLQREAESSDKKHHWEFSDDDKDNIQRLIDHLLPAAKAKWPSLRIRIVHTGSSAGFCETLFDPH